MTNSGTGVPPKHKAGVCVCVGERGEDCSGGATH